jgi:hypothetical protein
MSALTGATPLACSGHLLVDLPIFMGPVVLIVGWLLLTTRRLRRAEGEEEGGAPTPSVLPPRTEIDHHHRLPPEPLPALAP